MILNVTVKEVWEAIPELSSKDRSKKRTKLNRQQGKMCN